MPERLIVIATSNDASGLDEALLQRFDVFPFSGGPTFADACPERLAWIWQQEAGPDVPMPPEMAQMGWRKDNYSMRRALSAFGVPWKCTEPAGRRRRPYADLSMLVLRGNAVRSPRSVRTPSQNSRREYHRPGKASLPIVLGQHQAG